MHSDFVSLRELVLLSESIVSYLQIAGEYLNMLDGIPLIAEGLVQRVIDWILEDPNWGTRESVDVLKLEVEDLREILLNQPRGENDLKQTNRR